MIGQAAGRNPLRAQLVRGAEAPRADEVRRRHCVCRVDSGPKLESDAEEMG